MAHLLISAIKHVGQNDNKNTNQERRNDDLTDLQNLLTEGFDLPNENSDEKENISENNVELVEDEKVKLVDFLI